MAVASHDGRGRGWLRAVILAIVVEEMRVVVQSAGGEMVSAVEEGEREFMAG